MTIDVPITRLPGNDDITLPTYQTAGSAAMDLHAAVIGKVVVMPTETVIIPCGIAMAIPPGYEGQVRPRSGLAAKHSLTVLNAPGTIDEDYRGELKVILSNFGHAEFTVERGMRIAQLLIAPVQRIAWALQDKLPETARGAGGLGHTGH